MSLSQDQLEAEAGTVLPSRDTLSRFTFTNQIAFVWAPSTRLSSSTTGASTTRRRLLERPSRSSRFRARRGEIDRIRSMRLPQLRRGPSCRHSRIA